MTTTDLAVRVEAALELIDSGAFAERVEPLLPDTLPLTRFLQVAKTAIRTNPELVEADQRTLMGCLIRCAQDGLPPDGREAALAVFGGKVTYMPMIGGLRKNLAEYGWTLKTRVVCANDEFEYIEEPPAIYHVPVRPGAERGPMIAAYAVARHADGRKLQIVLDAEEIAARKAVSRMKAGWEKWPEQFWEKSAGHAIFDEIPRAERDRMTIPTDNGVDNAIEALYGPGGHEFPVRAAADAGNDDPEPQPPAPAEEEVPAEEPASPDVDLAALGRTVVPPGNAYAGKTLGEIAETQDGREWMSWALRNAGKLGGEGFAETLAAFAALLAQGDA